MLREQNIYYDFIIYLGFTKINYVNFRKKWKNGNALIIQYM